jgi:hypothetical protein
MVGKKKMKGVCPYCGGSNIGTSGMGEKYFHCFGHCMIDIPRDDIILVEASPDEVEVLAQETY